MSTEDKGQPLTKEEALEATSHEVNCPCTTCQKFWEAVDPNGDYLLPGQEPSVIS